MTMDSRNRWLALFVLCALLPGFSAAAQTAATAELKAQGLGLMDQGRFHEAVAAFREALKSAPHDSEILNDLGVALRKGGDFIVVRVRPDPPSSQSDRVGTYSEETPGRTAPPDRPRC